jgi:hypothetical protein
MSFLSGDHNPLSGETPASTFEDDSPTGLSDQGDSVADDASSSATSLDDSETPQVVADPAPGVAPAPPIDDEGSVNDTGGVGETRATEPEED